MPMSTEQVSGWARTGNCLQIPSLVPLPADACGVSSLDCSHDLWVYEFPASTGSASTDTYLLGLSSIHAAPSAVNTRGAWCAEMDGLLEAIYILHPLPRSPMRKCMS